MPYIINIYELNDMYMLFVARVGEYLAKSTIFGIGLILRPS